MKIYLATDHAGFDSRNNQGFSPLNTILIVGAIIIVSILIGLIIFSFARKQEVEQYVLELPDYYKYLAGQCESKRSYNCCLNSVSRMASGDYKLRPEAGCADGYKSNSLRCLAAFSWCEPATKNEFTENLLTDINKKIGMPAQSEKWKLYENIDYGLAFYYPNDWEILINNGSSEEGLPLNAKFTVSVYKSEQEGKNYLPNRNYGIFEVIVFDREKLNLEDWIMRHHFEQRPGPFPDVWKVEFLGEQNIGDSRALRYKHFSPGSSFFR